MAGENIYSGYGSGTLVPGGGFSYNFIIQSPGRRIRIKSILTDWQLLETISGNKIIWRDNPDVYMIFIIGDYGLTTPQISKPFVRTGGAPFLFNGNVINITEPKQVFFDSFYISNEIPFSFQVYNFTLVDVDSFVSCVIETEENPVF